MFGSAGSISLAGGPQRNRASSPRNSGESFTLSPVAALCGQVRRQSSDSQGPAISFGDHSRSGMGTADNAETLSVSVCVIYAGDAD